MRLLRLEFIPLLAVVIAFGQMTVLADRNTFELSYAAAALFSFVSLVGGVTGYLYLKGRNLTAARIAISTGVLFFMMLFGLGEYLFSIYFPT